MVKNPPTMWRSGFDPWVGKITWRRPWQPTPVFLPGESHGQRSLAGYSPRGCKESDTTEQLSTQLTCHEIQHIPVVFNMLAMVCKHNRHSVPEHFHHSKRKGCTTALTPFPSAPGSPSLGYRPTCSGHFILIYMQSYSGSPFVSDIFHLAYF